MSIKFNVIQRGEPGVTGGGVKKFYASAFMNGEETIESLTKNIEKVCTVHGADIRAVLYALVDVIKEDLSAGRIVRLGDLGSLRVGLSSVGKETAEDLTSHDITDTRTIFTPGAVLKEMLKNLHFQKV
jgi:predicted histone-like DNA-binding protein